MADLEEWEDGKALVQLCSKTRESLVGEEDISLHLSRNAVDGARIAQSQCFSSHLYRSICVEYCVNEGVCARR